MIVYLVFGDNGNGVWLDSIYQNAENAEKKRNELESDLPPEWSIVIEPWEVR